MPNVFPKRAYSDSLPLLAVGQNQETLVDLPGRSRREVRRPLTVRSSCRIPMTRPARLPRIQAPKTSLFSTDRCTETPTLAGPLLCVLLHAHGAGPRELLKCTANPYRKGVHGCRNHSKRVVWCKFAEASTMRYCHLSWQAQYSVRALRCGNAIFVVGTGNREVARCGGVAGAVLCAC